MSKEATIPGFRWMRSLRSPAIQLGSVLKASFRGHESAVNGLAISPDSTRLVSGSDDGTIRIWDVAGGEELHRIRVRTGGVDTVAFSPDGCVVAAVVKHGYDDTVQLWEIATEKLLAIRRRRYHIVTSVGFSLDGQYVFYSPYNAIRIWNWKSTDETELVRDRWSPVTSAAISPDGHRIARGTISGSIIIYDADSGAKLLTMGTHRDSVKDIVFNPDGTRIASASKDGAVRIWDASNGEQLWCLRKHSGWVYCVAWSPQGQLVASGSDDHTVRIWDSETGAEIERLYGHTGTVRDVVFALNGQFLASCASGGEILLWKVEKRTQMLELRGLDHHRSYARVNCLSFSPDGKTYAFGTDEGDVRVWDCQEGQEQHCWPHDSAELIDLLGLQRYSTFASLFFAGDNDYSRVVTSLAYSPDGQRIASGTCNGIIRVWNVSTGTRCLTFLGFRCRRFLLSRLSKRFLPFELITIGDFDLTVTCLSFSPDGRYLASGSEHGEVHLWDTLHGFHRAQVAVGFGHRRPRCLAFSPDGRRIAIGFNNGMIQVRDTAQFDLIRSFPWLGFSGRVAKFLFKLDSDRQRRIRKVAFSADGARIICQAGVVKTEAWKANILIELETSEIEAYDVRVLDANTGERLEAFKGHTDVDAIASERFHRILVTKLETAIQWSMTGQDVAWLPQRLREVDTHPLGWIWVGKSGGEVTLCRIEGAIKP